MSLEPAFRARLSRFLPPDLLDQLPAPHALTLAIRRLNSLHQAVSSFLPQYIAENESLLSEDHGDLRPGTFMFADVSGFTALSEKLQKEDRRDGADVMTEIINQYFGTMLEILAKSNGQLLKFAGDALLTFFPAKPNEDETPFAIRTGLRMQRAMAEQFQPIKHPKLIEWFGDHALGLTMSIGVARGKLFEAVIGNASQRDHMIQGDLPGLAMLAEAAGERDDVIIDAGLQAAYARLFDTQPVGDGFFRVIDTFGDKLSDYEFSVPTRRRGQSSALFDFVTANLLEEVGHQLERVESVARFVAPEIVNKLAFKGDHIESENRPATVIFMYFTGFADLLRNWGEDELPRIVSILDRYYSVMQTTITANGGSQARSDPYQQGVKLLITFGAPVAHPDDPERAVTTALEMHRQLALFNARVREELPDPLQRSWVPITQRAGITYGAVFAGEVGWKARREYTVMGDDVNLAARLMGKGEMGKILISERIWNQVHPHFETERLEPLQLKGKAAPVQAFAVNASTISALSMSATSETPFVGRDLQLLQLTLGLQQAKGPRRRQAFALVGEAGTGKTRMAKQIAEAAQQAGFVVAWANCQFRNSQDQSTWAALIFQLLQLDQAKSEQAQRRLLHVRLAERGVPELESIFSQMLFGTATPVVSETPAAPKAEQRPSAPVKNIFDMAQAKTDLTQSGIFGMARRKMESALETGERPIWDAVAKQTSLPDSIVRFFLACADDLPILLVIDDLHQAEPSVLAILQRVLAEITRAQLMILVAYEPGTVTGLDIRRPLTISDLDQGETAQMVNRVLNVSEAGPRLSQLVWERTRGRPLFIESLLGLLKENGQIEWTENRAELAASLAPETLPDDVRQLIISRLDRLPAADRALLQVAALLGDGFSVEALNAVGDLDDVGDLDATLRDLVQVQIIEPQPGGTYRFQHGLTRAAVYDTLNRMQRQKLHRTAAEYWSQQPEPERYVLTTAYHLIKGGTPLRALELIYGAAERAEGSGQIERAVELLTHALELFPHDESLRTQLARLQQAPG